MTATPVLLRSAIPAGHILGRKLDSIPFSAYHVVLIRVHVLERRSCVTGHVREAPPGVCGALHSATHHI